jgi:FtsH-binding integral membrane protein
MSESGIKILATNDSHYVDWQSIVAGSFIAAAISLVFLAFGSGLGLSLTSFQTDGPHPRTALLIAAAIWLLWVQVSSFIGGGYIAGRLRHRIGDAERHEIEMRDGAHGLTVWAVAVVFGSLIAGWLTLTSVSGAAKSASTFSTDYYVDKMLRNDAASSAPGSLNSASDNSQVSRVIAQAVATKSINDSDKSYLVQQIASRSGLSPADSEKRLNETISTLQTQAETARKYAVLIAFLTAASLLISAVAAWWGAISGGKHRDDAIDHSHLTSWR